MSLLCFIWDAEGQVALRRESPQFLREFPSSFERDLNLRPPRAEGIDVVQPSLSFFVCRHVSQNRQEKILCSTNLPKAKPHPIPLVKSCLQKAIRRGNAEAAASAAAYLMAHDAKEFLRRLPVVLVEEVGVVFDLPKVMWLAVAVQSGYEMQIDDLQFLLTLVTFAATYTQRTAPVKYSSLGSRLERVVGSLFSAACCDEDSFKNRSDHVLLLSRSLILRACYGGMAGDVEMLLAFAAAPEAWSCSIVGSVEGPNSYAEENARLSQELVNSKAIALRWISHLRQDGQSWSKALAPQDRLEAAVDMHCSDIVSQLLRFSRTRSSLCVGPTKENLEEILWKYRSSLNFRDGIDIKAISVRDHVPWWDHAFDLELSRLSRECWVPQSVASSTAPAIESAKRRKTSNSGGRQLSLFRFAAAPSGA